MGISTVNEEDEFKLFCSLAGEKMRDLPASTSSEQGSVPFDTPRMTCSYSTNHEIKLEYNKALFEWCQERHRRMIRSRCSWPNQTHWTASVETKGLKAMKRLHKLLSKTSPEIDTRGRKGKMSDAPSRQGERAINETYRPYQLLQGKREMFDEEIETEKLRGTRWFAGLPKLMIVDYVLTGEMSAFALVRLISS